MPKQSRRNRALAKIHKYADLAGVDREDRLVVASMLLDFDEYEVSSYADLDDDDLERLAIAFQGWFYIQISRWSSGTIYREAKKVIERCESPVSTELEPGDRGYIV